MVFRFAALALVATCARAQAPDARALMISQLDQIARADLEQRERTVAQIHTRQEAEQRSRSFRAKVLQLIGGLPARTVPVAVKAFGEFRGDGFRVEKIAYESLPGFWVTADVYVPAEGRGPFPAIVAAPGHGAAGKTDSWNWGVNFARNGIVALVYDPIGQGERLQYYDPKTRKSKVGNPTGEHGEANVQTMLIGDNIARYMVNDAMRGVDYLVSRPDIDAARIGAFGCSGGGTATAYFSVLDNRVKVAATACYITAFQELLASPTGVQDAEQSIPRFIEQGFDFADWVEAFAPKPYAIVSTSEDMFPFAGARRTYEEARGTYGLYGAEERLQWITGPGPHGNLNPIGGRILSFFTRYLKDGSAAATFVPVPLEHRENLLCTSEGQVSASLGAETVYSLNRARAASILQARHAPSRELAAEIRSLTGAERRPGGEPPNVEITGSEDRGTYRIDRLSLASDGNGRLSGWVAVPKREGRKPAVLMLDTNVKALAEIGGETDRLAKSGQIVMALEPRPTPAGTESIKSPYLGVFNLLSLRAFLVGRSIVGLRIDDTIRAVDWLVAREDVDRRAISGFGTGPMGIVLLHAGVLDPRIGRLTIKDALVSYRTIVEEPLHSNVSEMIVPGVLTKYDTGDLLVALSPRAVTIVSPRDAMGAPLDEASARRELAVAIRSDEAVGTVGRVRIVEPAN